MTKICEGVFEAKRDIKKSAPTAVDADSIRKLFKSGSNFFEQGLNNDFLSSGYEKDEFAFLIDGFELSKPLLPEKGMSVPPYDSSHKAGQ